MRMVRKEKCIVPSGRPPSGQLLASLHSAAPIQHPASRCCRRGITLLELAIVLAIAGVIVFIALPTLNPSKEEAAIDTTKNFLTYLHSQEQQYYGRHGVYTTLSKISQDEELGPDFDQRFAAEKPVVNGVTYLGPQADGQYYEIIAVLPDGSRYSVNSTGEIRSLQ